jgi:hypothetical protein
MVDGKELTGGSVPIRSRHWTVTVGVGAVTAQLGSTHQGWNISFPTHKSSNLVAIATVQDCQST